MSKTCHETIELMNLYLDGRLSGGQYQELAKHLEQCEHCRKRMNYLRVISSEIRADRPPMPDDLHSSIMNYIAKANAPAPERKFSLKKLQKPLAICAAALVLVIVTPLALSTMGNSADPSINPTGESGGWFSQLLDRLNFFGSQSAGEDADKDTSTDPGKDEGKPDPNDSADGTAGSGEADKDPSNQSGKTEGTYTVPTLHTREKFASYIVATGTVLDISAHFDLSSVAVYPQDGSVYVHLPNDAGSLAQAYNSIRQLGLTLHLAPKGLPEADENAPEILLVIFPK